MAVVGGGVMCLFWVEWVLAGGVPYKKRALVPLILRGCPRGVVEGVCTFPKCSHILQSRDIVQLFRSSHACNTSDASTYLAEGPSFAGFVEQCLHCIQRWGKITAQTTTPSLSIPPSPPNDPLTAYPSPSIKSLLQRLKSLPQLTPGSLRISQPHQ